MIWLSFLNPVFLNALSEAILLGNTRQKSISSSHCLIEINACIIFDKIFFPRNSGLT